MKIIISLLLALVVLELIFTLLTLITKFKDEISLAFSDDEIRVKILAYSHLPRYYKLKIQVENLYTNEKLLLNTGKIYSGKSDESTAFKLTENHCGVIQAKVIQAKSGIMTAFFMQKFNCDMAARRLFLPKTDKKNLATNENFRYIEPQKRSQTGEIIGAREYKSGDNLRNVHMKLSAKSGKYMVKECFAGGGKAVKLCIEKSENPETAHENAKGVLSQVHEVLSRGDCAAVSYGEITRLITDEREIEEAFFELLSQGRQLE